MGEAMVCPTVGQMVLGMRLRHLRERAGVGYDAAAKALHVNQTTVRRMEKAEVGLKLRMLKSCCRPYGVEQDEVESFLALVEEAEQAGWWHWFRDVLPDWFSLYVSLEGAASRIRAYEPYFVPGLLQTEDYARELLRIGFPQGTEREIDRRVALRMERQELLSRLTGHICGPSWTRQCSVCTSADRRSCAPRSTASSRPSQMPNVTLAGGAVRRRTASGHGLAPSSCSGSRSRSCRTSSTPRA